MLEWWNSLSLVSQIFAAVAIPATVIMVLQTVLLLLGIGGGGGGDADIDTDFDTDFDADLDADFDADLDMDGDFVPDSGPDTAGDAGNDGLTLFSVRGIVAFFSIGGWVGLVADSAGLPLIEAVVLSVVAGCGALVGVALLMKNAMKLQDSGNVNLRNAVGKTASVYLRIPPKGEGRGKVNVLVQSRLMEVEAVNAGELPIPTGQSVAICAVVDEDTVVVRALDIEPEITRGGISKWAN